MMNSGSPEPANELWLIIESKRNQMNETLVVVSEASAWLKAQLTGAKVDYSYTPCPANNPSAFGAFSVIRKYKGKKVALDLKVTEINRKPFVFAEVIQLGDDHGRWFPFFGDIATDEMKQNLLHYISDFLLDSQPC